MEKTTASASRIAGAIVLKSSSKDSVDGGLHRTFGTAAQLGNLRIAEIMQGIEQEPLPLGIGAERQHRQNFVQRFPMADQFFGVAQ